MRFRMFLTILLLQGGFVGLERRRPPALRNPVSSKPKRGAPRGTRLAPYYDRLQQRTPFSGTDGPDTQLVSGIGVEGLRPEDDAIVGADALGYPLDSISDLPPGNYWVQALLHR